LSMELEEEIRELEKRFSEAPDSRLFLPLADALRRAGELERAVKLCREGLERFPDFASVRVLLGECLAEIGDLEKAEQTLEKLVAEDSENLRVLKGLAGLAEQKGDKDRARALYDQLRTLEAAGAESDTPPAQPEDEIGLFEPEGEPPAGEEAARSEPFAEISAEEPVQRDQAVAQDQGPGELFLTHTLADIYRLQGYYEQAYEIYSKLIESEKEDHELKRKLEEVTSHLGGDSQAVEKPVEHSEPERKSSTDVMEPEAKPATSGIQAEKDEMRAGGGLNNRFEERIDRIFRFLLGDNSDSPVEGKSGKSGKKLPAGSDQFVEMLESWITNLRESEL